jgi:Putative zinc dependent peptidase (DUF5700)
MRRRLIILILIFVIQDNFSIAQDLNKQKIDFSSVDTFWDIAEKITNEKVSEIDWDLLFSTGYYKFYENWGQRKYIQNTLITAFSPKKRIERDSLIKINNFNSYVLMQIISTYTNKIQLQTFQKNLVQSNLRKKIIKRAKEYLPSDLNSQTYEPFIYFGVFQPDANASDKSIAIDLKLYYELADPIGLIAHEYHHFLTLNYRKKFKEIENDSTSLIMKSISQLQLEGIADMIDKDRFLSSDGRGFPSKISVNFERAHSDPLPALQKMDSLLVAISKDPSSTKQNSEAIFKLLPLGCHPHGFYMAKTILKVYGKRQLLSTVRNPFDFIRVYNNAYFKLNGMVVFSDEAIKFLNQVERIHSF